MLDIKTLSVGYRSHPVLKDVTVSALAGERIALVGPNGSGKSTLLKTLCGLLSPQSGTILINGQNPDSLPARLRARHTAYLPQIREAMPRMLVADIIALGRAPYRGTLGRISESGQNAIDAAAKQAQISEFLHRRFGELSGGEQARVLLARMLAVDASLLLADEPIAALDPFYQISMMEALSREATRGKTVITALHDLALAQKFSDRIWVMHEGLLVSDGPPEKALSPDILQSVFHIIPPQGGFQSPEIFDALQH